MNVRLLAFVAVGAVAAAVLLRDLRRGDPPPLPPARTRTARSVRPTPAPAEASTRNVFEYGPRPLAPPAAPPLPAASIEPPPLTAPPEPAVRLVGLVRRGGVTKAVLKVRGETMEVAAGATAGGYKVVAIDEDGVRLQAADGTAVTLTAGGQ